MKRHFALDENILILAQRMQDDNGRPTPLYYELLVAIQRNCHSLAFTQEIYRRYRRQIASYEHGSPKRTPRLTITLTNLIFNSLKDNRLINDEDIVQLPMLDGVPSIDVGDRDYAMVAATVPGAILVTTDRRFRERLVEMGIHEQYGFIVVTAEEAILLAGPDDSAE